jgi:hypothetical protein
MHRSALSDAPDESQTSQGIGSVTEECAPAMLAEQDWLD